MTPILIVIKGADIESVFTYDTDELAIRAWSSWWAKEYDLNDWEEIGDFMDEEPDELICYVMDAKKGPLDFRKE